MSDTTPAPPPLQSQTSTFTYNLSNPNEHLQIFYAAIGICITEWSSIEHVLLQLCNLALKTTDKITSIVYFRTPSLEGRTNLTDELLLAILPAREKKDGGHDHRLVKEWIGIRNDIKSELAVRNKLAHWSLAMVGEMKINIDPTSKAGTFSLTFTTKILAMSPGESAKSEKRPQILR